MDTDGDLRRLFYLCSSVSICGETSFRISTSRIRQLPVLDPMRLLRIDPQPRRSIRFIRRVVSLEPGGGAVSFEGQNMRRDALEEPAVVADDDGAASAIFQPFFQSSDRVDIQIV